MDSPKEHQEEIHKSTSHKAFSFFSKRTAKAFLIPVLILIMVLVSITFIQRPQVFVEHAATTPPMPNDCSPVPFYCLILGGGKTCTRPKVCPTRAPSPGFVPQSNPPKPTPTPTLTASSSATLACLPTPPSLDKLLVHFDFAIYLLRRVDIPALDNYAAALKKYPKAIVTVAGNTDSIDSKAFNKLLSQQRAQAVKDYLVRKGAATNKYIIVANGELKPIAPNTLPNGADNPAGRALNRRVEVTTDVNPQKCTTPSQKLTCTDGNGNSGYSGYNFSPPANANKLSVSTQWNVVATTCNPKARGFSIWPGIQTNDKLFQAGSYAFCSPVNYSPWTMAYPGPWVNPPKTDRMTPGDTMFTSITMTSKGRFTTVVTNKTRGWSFSVNSVDAGYKSLVVGGPFGAGQILIEDEGTQTSQLPPFNPIDVNFTNSQYSINGSLPASLASAPGLTCTNIARNGTLLDQVSNITGGNFTQTWKNL